MSEGSLSQSGSSKAALNRHIQKFEASYRHGSAVVRFFHAAGCQIIYARKLASISSNPWQLNLRLPREIEEEFGLSRELLVLATTWDEFQVRSLDTLREVVGNALRVEPEAGAVITQDPHSRDKAYEWCANDFTVFAFTPPQMVAATQAGSKAALQAVREALQEALFGRNFYDESGPVTGERFFGRSTLLNQIRSDFVNHKAVGLFGLRKIGKTSVTQQALQRLEAGEVSAYIDLGGERIHKDARHMLVTLTERLSRASIGGDMPNVRWSNSPDRFTSAVLEWLESVLSGFQERRLRFILALDEIEAILPTANHPGLDHWVDMLAAFRSLWQGYTSFQLVFVGVNPSIFERPSIGERDNPVFSFVRPTYVRCMSDREFARMVTHLGKRTGITWPAPVLDRLYTETGGHPYLSRQVCAVVVAGLTPPATVSLQLLEERLTEVLLARNEIFAEIFDSLRRHFPHELVQLQRIARDKRVSATEVSPSELTHLLGYELVSVDNGIVTQRIDLFARWLQQS